MNPPFSVRCAGINPGDGSTFNVLCPQFDGSNVTIVAQPNDKIACIEPVPGTSLVNVIIRRVTASGPWDALDAQPEPGDLVVAIGPDEPFNQQGQIGVIRADGTMAGCGIAALIAYDLAQNPPPPE